MSLALAGIRPGGCVIFCMDVTGCFPGTPTANARDNGGYKLGIWYTGRTPALWELVQF